VSLGGVAAQTGVSASGAAERFGFQYSATDPAEVLASPDTDAIVIATRHSTHASLITDALTAGKHVFCEKPVALSPDELKSVVDAATTARGLLAVGFNRRFAPHILAVKEALSTRTGPLVLSYRINAGPLAPESWVAGSEGGGRIVGELCHFADTMLFLAASLAIRVFAVRPEAAGDSVVAMLTFADGSAGTITYSSIGDPALPKERLEVFASGTAALLDDFRRLDLYANGRRSTHRRLRRDKGHKALLDAFVTAVRKGDASPTPLADIANATAVTFAIERSLLERREVSVEYGAGSDTGRLD
jgi:predicted dehydrogenase